MGCGGSKADEAVADETIEIEDDVMDDIIREPPPPPPPLPPADEPYNPQERIDNYEGQAIPGAYYISGAAIPQANGVYFRDGTYSGAPLFKNGQLWLLRYTMRSGNRFWYIADKDQLERDDGDLYRVRCPNGLPPSSGWGLAKDGQAPAPSLEPLADDGPAGFFVHNAGIEAANGAYALDGSYGSCPLYKQIDNGKYWLLRYRMPRGMHYWYIADQHQLQVDDGDLYRIPTDSDSPPTDGWQLAKDGVSPAPTLSPYYPATMIPTAPTMVAEAVVPEPVSAVTTTTTTTTTTTSINGTTSTTTQHTTVVSGVSVITSVVAVGTPVGGWSSVPVAMGAVIA